MGSLKEFCLEREWPGILFNADIRRLRRRLGLDEPENTEIDS